MSSWTVRAGDSAGADFFFALFPAGAGDCAFSAALSDSMYTNLSQATMKGLGVFFSPMPYTFIPASRRRVARRVKSLSLLTSTKPPQLPEYKMSMASMIMAESVAFLPWV